MSLSYPTDLTNAQWELIQPLLPLSKPGGRPRSTDLRSVVNALFYVLMVALLGDYSPITSPNGKLSIIIFGNGVMMGLYRKSINVFINGNVQQVMIALFP